ncbi:hypothetical protein P3X46_000867 [Hevea brasiliensis]|uniref:Myb/SANT-like domain-containing protein n=1 Tax=Hevea brasiliensis TaxID=3981 RepID=A0ABQ9NDU5_HEVBR|nr:hypothetical protein P3X46_000867 [Hevea brasiliensis]
MSAAQDGILGRPKAEWTPTRDAYLVELFIEQHNRGRTAYNEFKNEVMRSVAHDFNKKFDLNLEENQIKNHYNVMEKDYGIVKILLSHTEFGWAETHQMVIADDKVWGSYIWFKVKQGHFGEKAFLCIKRCPYYLKVNDISLLLVLFNVLGFSYMPGTGERVTGKFLVPSGISVETEDGNSNTETVQSSEPINLATQVVDGSRNLLLHQQETFENALYDMFSTATLRTIQRNVINEKTIYQKCLEELPKLEELNDIEFTKAINVLKGDKNATAFMTIRGPRRVMLLKSVWQA